MWLTHFLDMSSMVVCTTRHWHTTGRLVQICTVLHVCLEHRLGKQSFISCIVAEQVAALFLQYILVRSVLVHQESAIIWVDVSKLVQDT